MYRGQRWPGRPRGERRLAACRLGVVTRERDRREQRVRRRSARASLPQTRPPVRRALGVVELAHLSSVAAPGDRRPASRGSSSITCG